MPLQTQLVRPMTLLVQICQYRYLHPQAIAMDIMYIQEIPIMYTLELGMIIISTMAVIMDMVDMIMTVVIGSVVITTPVILEMVVTRMAVIMEPVDTTRVVIIGLVVTRRAAIMESGNLYIIHRMVNP